jgi:hypothetical protein
MQRCGKPSYRRQPGIWAVAALMAEPPISKQVIIVKVLRHELSSRADRCSRADLPAELPGACRRGGLIDAFFSLTLARLPRLRLCTLQREIV